MTKNSIVIRVEGIDARDSSESAADLRESLLNKAAELGDSDFSIRMDRSDPNAQDASGDVLHMAHFAVLSVLTIVETIKLWREVNRDKALIIEAKHGSAIRVELSDPDAAKRLEDALLTKNKAP